MTAVDIRRKAANAFPNPGNDAEINREQEAYFRGYSECLQDSLNTNEKDFFVQVSEGLRNLWPSGNKDGKWPWRDSVTNIAKRLEFIWKERDFKDKYTVDDCLSAGRRYLAQFENNAKYMQVLKYFVFKQDKIVAHDGRITFTYKSNLADYLESQSVSKTQEEWASAFESDISMDEGVLI